jgi:AcrR family transcriptional regulator
VGFSCESSCPVEICEADPYWTPTEAGFQELELIVLSATSDCEFFMNKRETLLKTAARLFAAQGFDGTTTLQIAREAGVTEPSIYYHFKGKDELFTSIIKTGFLAYLSHFETLEQSTDTPFEQISKLIELQFDIVEAMPDELRLIASACPARLNDPDGICARGIREYQSRNKAYFVRCLSEGIETGEIEPVPVDETASLLVAYINGIIRYKAINLEETNNMRQTAIDFCRRSLMNNKR